MSAQGLVQRTTLRQQGKFLLAQRAQTLELDAPSFKELLRRVEADGLFHRLTDREALGGALVKRQPCLRMRAVPAGGGAALEAATAPSGFEVGRTIAEHAEGVDALRRLGLERAVELLALETLGARRRFLAACGLDEESAELVLALCEHLSVFGAMTALEGTVLPQVAPCAPVARLESAADGTFEVVPLVSYFRPERFAVDYERISAARREGFFTAEEARRLPALLGEIESINYRGDTLRRVLCGLADSHSAFLRSGREEDLAPLTQRALSETIGVHRSAVCRAVAGRSLLTPRGTERALISFFPGRGSRKARAVADVLAAQPHLTDREVAQRLREIPGCRCSRRAVAIYRCALSIPNSYSRREAVR